MNKYLIILTITILLSTAAPHAGQQSGTTFNGSMYTDLGLLHTVHSSSKDEADFAGMSLFSLNPKNANRTFGKVECLFDVIVPYGRTITRYVPEIDDSSDADQSLPDYYKIFSFGKTPVLFDLRKLYLSVYLPFADITMGRQIVNFGKGFVFSPIDVFSSVELYDINFRRRGSDIVDILVPFSAMAGIDLICEMPFLDESCSVAAKIYATLFDFDFSPVGIFRNNDKESDFENETVFGLTFKGDAAVGIYGEAVGHYINESKDLSFEGMLGADYSIKDRWYFICEYLYKQHDWTQSIWGEHNIFGSARFRINDITNISASIIYDFEKESTLGIAQFYYNILQNVNTIIYLQGSEAAGGKYLLYSARVEVKF